MAKKNAKKKSSKARDVNSMSMDELTAVIQEETKSDAKTQAAQSGGSGSVVINFLVALWVAAMPIYLYLTPMFDLSIDEHSLYFGVVTLITAVCLTMAYSKTAEKERKRLRKKFPAPNAGAAPTSGKKKKASRSSRSDSSIAVEAAAWSLFYNNVFFLGLFMILAFNVVPDVVPKFINYIVAVAGPGLVVHFLS